ncbi:hypothetical protein K9857_13965 [Pseudomonas sp. REP124]|uniref:hypothetical protein n=1 Tax=Pseudomonas sp. REP124 TaxID=2875731 RepID=UPI001CCB52CB|nr:hypothetical protein [Pseudomonas sp. REP124]MBZ9782646.1 hypothetical protein [Pseudomonas sp. REP124]
MFFYNLTSTRIAVFLFVLAVSLVYMWLPLFVNFALLPSEYFLKLAFMTFFAIVSVLVGYSVPLFDSRFRPHAIRIRIPPNTVHFFVWFVFIFFLFITLYTAPAIPILSAISGADTDELSVQRGAFLKGREGAEVALIYVSTIFVSAFLPYSLARMFIDKHKYRYVFLLIFFGYSVSFLQKALFLNALLPLFYIASQRKKISFATAVILVVACAGVLYLVTLLAMGGTADSTAVTQSGGVSAPEFYSSKYLPSGAIDHLVWRIVAVPMFTAADTLVVLKQQFDDLPLLGATSTFFSALFSLDRVYLEKLVFEYEWGWNDTANSNAVFFTEGFANFGWLGVWLYSFFVGQTFRWFRKSEDDAFKALWLIYFLGLFTGGLIGTLLSNGYLLMFFANFFLSVRAKTTGENKLNSAY